jgi:hypothetical protein
LTTLFNQNKIDVVNKKKSHAIITDAVLLLKSIGFFSKISCSLFGFNNTKKLIPIIISVMIINSALPGLSQKKYAYPILNIAIIKKDSEAEIASFAVNPGSFSL